MTSPSQRFVLRLNEKSTFLLFCKTPHLTKHKQSTPLFLCERCNLKITFFLMYKNTLNSLDTIVNKNSMRPTFYIYFWSKRDRTSAPRTKNERLTNLAILQPNMLEQPLKKKFLLILCWDQIYSNKPSATFSALGHERNFSDVTPASFLDYFHRRRLWCVFRR